MSDPFSAAPAAKVSKFPTVKQLGTGAEKRTVVYAPDTEDEQVVKNCTGRLVIFQPTKLEKNHPSRYGTQDRMSVTVTVLDGEPITEAVDKNGQVTYTFEEPLTPAFQLTDMYFSQMLILDQLKAALESRSMVLGRLVLLPPRGATGNPAWAIGAFSEEDKELALTYIKANPLPDPFA